MSSVVMAAPALQGLINSTPGSIGYVELILHAAVQQKMSYASVKNAAGKVIKPSFEGVTILQRLRG